jgi:hypothetical protein
LSRCSPVAFTRISCSLPGCSWISHGVHVGVSDVNSACCPQGEPFSDGMTTLAKNIPDSLRATQLGQLADVAIPK